MPLSPSLKLLMLEGEFNCTQKQSIKYMNNISQQMFSMLGRTRSQSHIRHNPGRAQEPRGVVQHARQRTRTKRGPREVHFRKNAHHVYVSCGCSDRRI